MGRLFRRENLIELRNVPGAAPRIIVRVGWALLLTLPGAVNSAEVFVASQNLEERDWSSGWTSSVTYEAGGQSTLFMLKESTGDAHVHRLSDGCTENGGACIGPQIGDYEWSSGWTHVESYPAGGSSFLLLYKNGSGDVHVNPVGADGLPNLRIVDAKVQGGWTSVTAYYTAAGHPYILAMNSTSGAVRSHPVMRGGSRRGAPKKTPVFQATWTKGWTHAVPFSIDGDPYVMIYKEHSDNGVVHIHRVLSDGTWDPNEHVGYLGTSWSLVDAIEVDGRAYIFVYNKLTGASRIHGLNDDGSLMEKSGEWGGMVYQNGWSTGWSGLSYYTVDGRIYRFLLKDSDGTVHVDEMVTAEPSPLLEIWQHRGAPHGSKADHDLQNSLEGFELCAADPTTRGMEIDVRYEGGKWYLCHDSGGDCDALFSFFLDSAMDSWDALDKTFMLEVKTDGDMEALEALIAPWASRFLVISFNTYDQLEHFAVNGYQVGMFVQAGSSSNSFEAGLAAFERYRLRGDINMALMWRWSTGTPTYADLVSWETECFERSIRLDKLRLWNTGIGTSTILDWPGGGNPAHARDEVLLAYQAKEEVWGNPYPVVTITDHPHGLVSNYLAQCVVLAPGSCP